MQDSERFVELIERAMADPRRVEREVELWKDDPDSYIGANFQRLVEYDFPVYAQGNIQITDKAGNLIWFKWNRVQRQLWRWLLEDLAHEMPVRWFILKARQMGVSTWVLVFFYWLCSLRPNRNTLVLTHDEDAVQNFNSRVSSMHTYSHESLRPETAVMNRDLIHFGTSNTKRKAGKDAGLDSRMIFQTAKKTDVGRSYNFQAVLCSEYALWPNQNPPIDLKEVMTGLTQAVARMPGTMIIKESTAKGENTAKDEWDDELNGYRKIFVPWVAYDEYSAPMLPGEILNPPVSEAEEVGGAQTRYGDEVIESALIRAALIEWSEPGEDYRKTDEWLSAEILRRLKWRREKIDKDCSGDKMRFRQEYPTVADHAFGGTSRACFDPSSIEQMRLAVNREGLAPTRATYLHDPSETDPNRKFKADLYGKVQFYRLPESTIEQFVIGGDTSMGLSPASDPSALVVLATPDLEEVASFNGVIPPEQLGELAYYLGILFNTALIGIEHNERGGAVANTVLKSFLHYPRIYYARDPYTMKRSKMPGFVTTDVNKSAMVADLAQLIRDHEILFRSPGLIDPIGGQLVHYIEHPDGTLGGAQGWRDDLVSAALIAAFLAKKIHQFPPPPPTIPKGSFLEAAQQHLASRGRRGRR